MPLLQKLCKAARVAAWWHICELAAMLAFVADPRFELDSKECNRRFRKWMVEGGVQLAGLPAENAADDVLPPTPCAREGVRSSKKAVIPGRSAILQSLRGAARPQAQIAADKQRIPLNIQLEAHVDHFLKRTTCSWRG